MRSGAEVKDQGRKVSNLVVCIIYRPTSPMQACSTLMKGFVYIKRVESSTNQHQAVWEGERVVVGRRGSCLAGALSSPSSSPPGRDHRW